MQHHYSLYEFLDTIHDHLLGCGFQPCCSKYPKMLDDVIDAITKILNDHFNHPGKSELKRLYRNWNGLLDQYFTGSHDKKTINRLKKFKVMQIISTPFQYENILVMPLLTALDFYIEERRLRNCIIWNLLGCYMGGTYVFSVRVNNESLSSLIVTLGESNNVKLDEQVGRDMEEPDNDCGKAAEEFLAYLNEEISKGKIILPKVSSKSSKVTWEHIEFMHQRMMKKIKVLETILAGTFETKFDLINQVLGLETLNKLFEQLNVQLKQKHKGKYKPIIEMIDGKREYSIG